MASEIVLEVYTFQIREKGDTSSYKNLSIFPEKKNDFYDFLHHYFTYHTTDPLKHEEMKKTMSLAKKNRYFDNSNRMISGLIDSGEYGKEGNIIDETGVVKHRKTKDQSDMQPFYFLVYVPTNSLFGYILLQRSGVHGINNIFTKGIEATFLKDHPNCIIEFNAFISKELAQKIATEGAVKQVVLRQNNFPSDFADKFGTDNILQGNIRSIKIIMALDGRKKANAKKAQNFLMDGNAAFFDMPVELKSLGFSSKHQTMLKISIKGRMRTIDMSDSGTIRPYFDITDDVELSNSGHPKFESIDKVAKQLIIDLTDKTHKK